MLTNYSRDREFQKFMGAFVDFESIAEWVRENSTPEELFGEDTLHEWAKENGYVEADE